MFLLHYMIDDEVRHWLVLPKDAQRLVRDISQAQFNA